MVIKLCYILDKVEGDIMYIRQATVADYELIYDLVKEAFKTAKETDGTEQDFVVSLRNSENYLPELEFVAVQDDQLIGHIMLTKQVVQSSEGSYQALLLAPLCVAKGYRNQGIGGQLIEYAKKAALKAGYQAIFLLGDYNYYGRFGFQAVSHYQIKNIANVLDEYVLGCELVDDALLDIHGTIKLV